jgi:hypothetical protein
VVFSRTPSFHDLIFKFNHTLVLLYILGFLPSKYFDSYHQKIIEKIQNLRSFELNLNHSTIHTLENLKKVCNAFDSDLKILSLESLSILIDDCEQFTHQDMIEILSSLSKGIGSTNKLTISLRGCLLINSDTICHIIQGTSLQF